MQVLEELKGAASCAKRPGSVFMLAATEQHMNELSSKARRICQKWQQTRRFQTLEQSLASPDVVLNAVSPLLSELFHKKSGVFMQQSKQLQRQ